MLPIDLSSATFCAVGEKCTAEAHTLDYERTEIPHLNVRCYAIEIALLLCNEGIVEIKISSTEHVELRVKLKLSNFMVFRFSQLHFLSLFSFQVKEKDPTLGCNHEFP